MPTITINNLSKSFQEHHVIQNLNLTIESGDCIYIHGIKKKKKSTLFKIIAGIPCPGCGMTRSLLSFITFHFQESFYYHALLIPTGIFVVLFYVQKNQQKRNHLIYVWAGLMIIYYIYRMAIYFPNKPMEYHADNLIVILIKMFHY